MLTLNCPVQRTQTAAFDPAVLSEVHCEPRKEKAGVVLHGTFVLCCQQ